MDTGFVKNIIITGFTCSGKTFFVMYIIIYAGSKGLTVITVAMVCHLAIQLGGCHWHKKNSYLLIVVTTCLSTK